MELNNKLLKIANDFIGDVKALYKDEDDDESFYSDYNINPEILSIPQGASKIVLVIKDEDFVIKLPFKGKSYYQDDYCEKQSEIENGNHKCDYNCDACESWNSKGRDCFENFYSAPYQNQSEENCYGWDYCLSEHNIYLKAEKEGLSHLFAKTELIGHTDSGIPVYKQAKVKIPNSSGNTKPPSQNSKDRLKELSEKDRAVLEYFDDLYSSMIIEYYGEEDLVKLVEFLDRLYLGDFHDNNIGYLEDNRPILFDYSDYSD